MHSRKCLAGGRAEAGHGSPRVEQGGGVFRGVGSYLCGCLVNANIGPGKQNQALEK